MLHVDALFLGRVRDLIYSPRLIAQPSSATDAHVTIDVPRNAIQLVLGNIGKCIRNIEECIRTS